MLSFLRKIQKMYNKVACRCKAVFSRCLKSFKKVESHEVKEYGNCCCNLQKKFLLTGFSEIAKSKRCRRMPIKLFVFFLCTSGFLYQTSTFLEMYLAYPTTLDISEEYPDSFLAPALTVCNRNRLLRQPYCNYFPEKCTWEHTTWESFCYMYRRMCPKIKPPDFNFGIPEFKYLLTPGRSYELLNVAAPTEKSNIMTMIQISGTGYFNTSLLMAYFSKDGFPYRCFSLFSVVLNYNEATFNMTLPDWYSVELDLHPEEYFNTIDSVQASIVLHDPRKLVNPMTEGITLTSGKIYRLFTTMERIESLPPPYASNCKDYLTEWKENGGYGPLSKDDCINQCIIDETILKFGCVGQTMTYRSYGIYSNICEHPSYEISSEEHTKCATDCPDACEENIYHITVDDVFDFSGAFNATDEHGKSQFMSIYISFDRMKVKKFKQIPRFESIELFSYIGGYLGLWLGISIASVFDLAQMIYDVIGDAFLKRKRNKKRTTPIEEFQHHTTVEK